VPPTNTPTEVTPQPTATPPTKPGYFSRDELIEDTRQLAHVIESAHPDPYIRGGGRIAFHRRLHRLLNAIPEEGMTKDEFVRLLRPFVAAVGDAHTDLWDDYRVNDLAPGGVPLQFGIVEKSLYVAGVPGKAHEDLIGSILVSVEGVPLVELFQRQEQLQGTDNEYQVLQLLANQSLRYRPHMQDLLPEWENTDRVTVELKLQTGDIQEVVFDLSQTMPSLLTPKSEITLPAVNRSGFVYDFMDAEKRVAYLRVEHMMYYREAYEMWAVSGYRASTEETRATIPSATETFRSLVMDMKEAETQALIIDLRGNNGGNSVLADILLYFLYGKESLVSFKTHSSAAGGGQGLRVSDLYFENYSNVTLESMNEGRAVPLLENDYDFTFDFTDDVQRFQEVRPEAPAVLESEYRKMPTFYAEYELGTYEGYYRPESIMVLIDPGTFSSGFTMAMTLDLAGAVLLGTPSAQAANSFGNVLQWRLNHTGIQGGVSCAYFITSPEDQEKGRIWPVHYPLTYKKLASFDFDPNAEYLYALELLSE
jgi:hypothetical protein